MGKVLVWDKNRSFNYELEKCLSRIQVSFIFNPILNISLSHKKSICVCVTRKEVAEWKNGVLSCSLIVKVLNNFAEGSTSRPGAARFMIYLSCYKILWKTKFCQGSQEITKCPNLLFVPLDFGFSSWSKPTTQDHLSALKQAYCDVFYSNGPAGYNVWEINDVSSCSTWRHHAPQSTWCYRSVMLLLYNNEWSLWWIQSSGAER